ncbi:MAG: cyclic nucleotide-binding domain-containing protein [Proteobacteria bacterium]|nr:cyclic nucleotide-binding domain-containing protein [Pseudomonadota bacterium]MCP4917665.1 cyclic nucleotide-binding domain-containing protein [Pseudomonadota bacterium]
MPKDQLKKALELLLANGAERRFKAGDVLAKVGDASDLCWLIVEGSVDEWGVERRFAIRRPGQFTGEISVLSKAEQSVGITARQTGVAIALDGDFIRDLTAWPLPLASAWLGEVARHALAWSKDAAQSHATHTKQNYPYTNPMVFPGPHVATKAEMVYIPCTVSEGVMSGCVAPGVGPGPFFWIGIVRYHGGVGLENALEDDAARYDEVLVMVPSTMPGRPGLYVPWIYVGSAAALAAGREVFGYPKMLYNATLDDPCETLDEGASRCVFRKKGDDVLTARWLDIGWRDAAVADRIQLVHAALNPYAQTDERAVDDLAKDARPDRLMAYLQRRVTDGVAMQVGSWKRSFHPSTSLPGPGPVEWSADQFQIDGIAGSKATVTKLESFGLVQIKELQASTAFILPGATPLLGIGFRCMVDFSLQPDAMLRDYLSDTDVLSQDDRTKLAWGPKAWGRGG